MSIRRVRGHEKQEQERRRRSAEHCARAESRPFIPGLRGAKNRVELEIAGPHDGTDPPPQQFAGVELEPEKGWKFSHMSNRCRNCTEFNGVNKDLICEDCYAVEAKAFREGWHASRAELVERVRERVESEFCGWERDENSPGFVAREILAILNEEAAK